MSARATIFESPAGTTGGTVGTVRKLPPGRAGEARRDGTRGGTFGVTNLGEESRHPIENTLYKAGKKRDKSRLTFTTEEMRLRVLKHLLSLHRKKGLDPLKIARTIARREQMAEGDVRFILHGLIVQYRIENTELHGGVLLAQREIRAVIDRLSELLELAASAGAACWRKAS